jgi:CBS domain-containing protein
MRREYPAVDKDETLEHALRVMERYELDRVLAFESKRLVGVMTKRDVMVKLATLRTRSLMPGRLHVSSFMTPNPVTVEPSIPAVEAARIMLEREIGSLPVVDESGDVVGLVTRWEVAQLATYLHDVRAVDVMVTAPVTLKTGNRVLHARQVLLQYGLIFVPVVDDEGRPVGYVTVDEVADAFIAIHDVAERYRRVRVENLLVDDIMRLRPPVVEPSDTLPRIYEAITARRSKGAVVVREGRVVGMVTLVELMKAVALRMNV